MAVNKNNILITYKVCFSNTKIKSLRTLSLQSFEITCLLHFPHFIFLPKLTWLFRLLEVFIIKASIYHQIKTLEWFIIKWARPENDILHKQHYQMTTMKLKNHQNQTLFLCEKLKLSIHQLVWARLEFHPGWLEFYLAVQEPNHFWQQILLVKAL